MAREFAREPLLIISVIGRGQKTAMFLMQFNMVLIKKYNYCQIINEIIINPFLSTAFTLPQLVPAHHNIYDH